MAIKAKAKSLLNRFQGKGQFSQLGNALQAQKGCVASLYDFSVSGGATSTITLKKALLPANAVVTDVYYEALVTATSGGAATVTLLAGATALTGAIAVASLTGLAKPALAGAVAAIKVAAESDIKITIATATLTAGKIRFFVEYAISEDSLSV